MNTKIHLYLYHRLKLFNIIKIKKLIIRIKFHKRDEIIQLVLMQEFTQETRARTMKESIK